MVSIYNIDHVYRQMLNAPSQTEMYSVLYFIRSHLALRIQLRALRHFRNDHVAVGILAEANANIFTVDEQLTV